GRPAAAVVAHVDDEPVLALARGEEVTLEVADGWLGHAADVQVPEAPAGEFIDQSAPPLDLVAVAQRAVVGGADGGDEDVAARGRRAVAAGADHFQERLAPRAAGQRRGKVAGRRISPRLAQGGAVHGDDHVALFQARRLAV